MDIMSKLFSKIDFPKLGFLLFLVYNFITGFNLASAIASFAICGLYGFKMLLDARKVIDINDELLKKIAYLESSVNVIKMGSGFKIQDNNEKSKRLF